MNPESDKPCVFPFKYRGKEYNECTTEGWGNVYWCGTAPTAQENAGWGLCKCPECGCPAPQSKNEKETAKIHKGIIFLIQTSILDMLFIENILISC